MKFLETYTEEQKHQFDATVLNLRRMFNDLIKKTKEQGLPLEAFLYASAEGVATTINVMAEEGKEAVPSRDLFIEMLDVAQAQIEYQKGKI